MPTVSIVEHDPTLRQWCRLHLEAQEFTVLAFEDAGPALEAARLEPTDLLIVATDLLNGGGFALAAAIRSDVRTSRIPILFLVPTHDSEAFAHAISISPYGVIAKPLTRAVLLESVASRVGGANALSSADRSAATLAAPGLDQIGGAAVPSGGSGLLLDARIATVLAVVLRNFVSLARALSPKSLDMLLRRFMIAAHDGILEQGGWIVRADATGLVGLFEDGPKPHRAHATRAIESALAIVLAARHAKRGAESEDRDASFPDLSVGCGIHTGEVIIVRPARSGHLALTIAGQTADLAHRLDGRAKGLGWSVAASDSAVLATGARFQMGRRANLTDTDHGVTLSISEVLGFNPGTAKPGELPIMAEVREAVLANTMLASLAGDVDQLTADRTIVVTSNRAGESQKFPALAERRVVRRVAQGSYVTSYLTVHLPTDREDLVKIVQLSKLPPRFVDSYLEEYRKLSGLQHRNVVGIHAVEQTAEGGYVAMEFLSGGDLPQAIRRKLAVGWALNCLAQMCMALDAIHGIGMVHGALRAEHFLFRQDRVLVLSDFNVTERVGDSLGLAYPAPVGIRRKRQTGAASPVSGLRVDFHALGRILHLMLTGETALAVDLGEDWRGDKLFNATRLPLPLSPLQPCLDGLLGVGSVPPVERAEDVLVELLGLRDIFPFDTRQTDVGSTPRAREFGRV